MSDSLAKELYDKFKVITADGDKVIYGPPDGDIDMEETLKRQLAKLKRKD
jgi:hypothetical protein